MRTKKYNYAPGIHHYNLIEVYHRVQPVGYVTDDTDCDDTATAINPAATEICDGIDNDCDTLVDDADPDLDLSTALIWYADSDGDSYGDPLATLRACDLPSGYLTEHTDCDDTDAAIHPGGTDGLLTDGDCDGSFLHPLKIKIYEKSYLK